MVDTLRMGAVRGTFAPREAEVALCFGAMRTAHDLHAAICKGRRHPLRLLMAAQTIAFRAGRPLSALEEPARWNLRWVRSLYRERAGCPLRLVGPSLKEQGEATVAKVNFVATRSDADLGRAIREMRESVAADELLLSAMEEEAARRAAGGRFVRPMGVPAA